MAETVCGRRCKRCGVLQARGPRDMSVPSGKCRVFPDTPGLRDYHDWEGVQLAPVEVVPVQRGAESWTCEHGTTYTGSDDFISGARNAHAEFEGRAAARAGEHRSANVIAQEIIDAAPQVESLVAEWFAATTGRLNERHVLLYERGQRGAEDTEATALAVQARAAVKQGLDSAWLDGGSLFRLALDDLDRLLARLDTTKGERE